MSINVRSATNDGALQVNGVDAVEFNSGGVATPIKSITATVAANALSAGLNPCPLDFRSATLTDGANTSIMVNAALSLVVPDTATLGCVSAVQSRLVLLAINNAGTVELAIVNQSGGNDLSETGVISTTAIDATADSANVIYSTTARTNVAYRVVGVVESTQATAGTWVTTPSLIQGAGGNALTAMSSLGYGQTWQNVAGSRSSGVTYYNTTGRPISVNLSTTSATIAVATVDGIKISSSAANGNAYGTFSFIVPNGSSYSISYGTVDTWVELR